MMKGILLDQMSVRVAWNCCTNLTHIPVMMQLQGSTARAILTLQHLPEYQQPFSPLGILSCSAVCAGILAKLAPSLQSHQHSVLTQLQVTYDFSSMSMCNYDVANASTSSAEVMLCGLKVLIPPQPSFNPQILPHAQ